MAPEDSNPEIEGKDFWHLPSEELAARIGSIAHQDSRLGDAVTRAEASRLAANGRRPSVNQQPPSRSRRTVSASWTRCSDAQSRFLSEPAGAHDRAFARGFARSGWISLKARLAALLRKLQPPLFPLID